MEEKQSWVEFIKTFLLS